MALLTLRPVAARAQDKTPARVVFYAPPELTSSVRAALEDALTTQLSLIETGLYFALAPPGKSNPADRLSAARKIAAASGALGVFWLEASGDSPWLLYAVDARAERMIVRPLASHQKSSEPEADIEAVALIVRATTQALLHGEPLPSVSTGPVQEIVRDTTPWPVELLDAGHSALRITGSFVTTTFAKDKLEPGFAVRGAWLWPSGTYVGLGVALMLTSTFDYMNLVRFEIDRYPFSLHAGLRFGFSRLTFIGELGAEVEIRRRRTQWAANLQPSQDERRILYNVCPKLETELALLPWLVTFLSAGLDVVIGNFAYSLPVGVTMDNKTILQPVVEPHWIRLSLQIGIGIIH